MKEREALKLALVVLKEVQSETFRLMRNGQKLYAEEKVWNAITAIKEALAQPEQRSVSEHLEPVAVVCNVTKAGQEGVKVTWIGGFPQIGMRLYITPPQPQNEVRGNLSRKPLTHEQAKKIIAGQDWGRERINNHEHCMSIIRDTEAAHGIKE